MAVPYVLCCSIIALVLAERPTKQGLQPMDIVLDSYVADVNLPQVEQANVLRTPPRVLTQAFSPTDTVMSSSAGDANKAQVVQENVVRAPVEVSMHSHSSIPHEGRDRLFTKLNKKAGSCAHSSPSHPMISLLAAEQTTIGDQTIAGASALQTEGQKPLVVNVAASNYDSYTDDNVVFLGLSGLPKRDAYGNTVDASASICFCDGASYLNIQGARHEVTAMMYKGESLCMGKCPLHKFILENFQKGSNEDNEYVIQIEELPNAPIRLRIDALQLSKAGVDQAMISIQSGDMGQLIPAWISIRGGLQVFIGDLNIGCLKNLRTSSDVVEVGHDRLKLPPSFESVTLSHRNGETDTFYLPALPRDDTASLSDAVMDIVRGGDAVIETCFTVPDGS